jgi:hypothetical protein
MAKDNIVVHNLRLNLDNPQHQKINKVLQDLNPNIFKSKNRFLADAVEMYIDSFEKEDLTKEESKKKAQRQEYISREDLEEIKKEIRYELLTEVRNEVIKLLGGVVAGMQVSHGIPVANSIKQEVTGDETDEVDETMKKLALSWS